VSGRTDVVTEVRPTEVKGTGTTAGASRAPGAPAARRAPRAAARPAPPGSQGSRARTGAAGAPVRGRPGARPGPPRTGPAGSPRARPGPPQRRPDAAAARVARPSRTPFVFLVIGLLCGGLLSLLMINTILDTGVYQITQLQQQDATLAQQTQELQAQIAYQESPEVLAGRAHQLGMREPSLLYFLDLRKGRIDREPTSAPGVSVYPPGYTP
jgi:peptidoglycan hydrolase-like protein with peptidoglycan-binding domain